MFKPKEIFINQLCCMKNKYLITLLFSLISLSAFSQEESSDSIDVKQLNEIVIEAPKVIRKADMDVYYPSKSAVDNSKNGMQLITNLMIPSMFVNDALGSITAAGQSVQVRINGRQATVDQVRALLPETIKKVEWMENPSLILLPCSESRYCKRLADVECLYPISYGTHARHRL